MRKQGWAVVLAALVCQGAAAQDGTEGGLPPIPDKDAQLAFKDVPAPWRDYFLQAREAERLDDRLQRCLAYPDLPGNRWPAGHAAAHCRIHALKPLALAEFDGYLERGETAALDALLDGLLAKHFSADGDGEDIHVAIEAFGGAGPEVDRVSARWLALAPDSAYALLARAEYYRNAAWQARGGKWAAETPRESMRRMTGLVEQAIPLYRKAIRLQPRLMPAYAGLLNLAMVDSRADLEREAVAGAQAQDPACLEMARARMHALQPRWGGSYQDMLSYAAELSPHVARRPQLANHVAAPYGDRGDRLIAEGEFTRETAEILDIAVRTGSNEGHLRDAGNVALNLRAEDGGPDRWKGVAMLLQEHRFNELSAWAHRQIASQLVRMEPQWSLRHALKADELDPGKAWGQYLLAAGNGNSKRFELANRYYLAAADSRDYRQASLRELAVMWMFEAGLEPKQGATRAKPHVDRLLEDYPTDGLGWLLRLNVEGAVLGHADIATLEMFLRHADRNDPRQAAVVRSIEAARQAPGRSPAGRP